MKKIDEIKIRKAEEYDADKWTQILHDSAKNIYSNYISKEYIDNNYNIESLKKDFINQVKEQEYTNGGTELYMVLYNEEVVGILKIGKPIRYYTDGNNYYRDDIDGIGEIKSLHIKSDYQGLGIGSYTMNFAENRLIELNYQMSHVWVKIQNTKAIDFYISNGYKKTNYINPNTNDKAPSMVMEKNLNLIFDGNLSRKNSNIL